MRSLYLRIFPICVYLCSFVANMLSPSTCANPRDPPLVFPQGLVEALVGRRVARLIVRGVDVELDVLVDEDLGHGRDDHPDEGDEGHRRDRGDLVLMVLDRDRRVGQLGAVVDDDVGDLEETLAGLTAAAPRPISLVGAADDHFHAELPGPYGDVDV